MKKIVLSTLVILSVLTITGCGNQNKETEKSSNSTNKREVEGSIVKASINDDGNIVINENDITTTATYISYEYEDVVIGLLAVRDSKDNVKVVINTCVSCGGSPYAYFVQVKNKLECQNCGSLFDIDNLDNLEDNGCHPIKIEDMTDSDGKIIIGTEQLKNLKDKFTNWKGPKAQ